MAWSSPITPASLSQFTVTIWNTYVRDNLNYLYGRLVLQRLAANVTPVSNGTTVETDLMTYDLPADTLSANGMAIDVLAFGTSANNANVKTVKVYFGATVVLSFTVADTATPWRVRMHVMRTGAATQVATADATGTTGTGVLGGGAAPAEDLTTDTTIKVTGQSDTASADLTQVALSVRLVP
jgi:hypothetical protein